MDFITHLQYIRACKEMWDLKRFSKESTNIIRIRKQKQGVKKGTGRVHVLFFSTHNAAETNDDLSSLTKNG